MLNKEKQLNLGKLIKQRNWQQVVTILQEEGYKSETIRLMLKKCGIGKEEADFLLY